MSAPILQTIQLTKVYPSGVRALDRVQLSVQKGEFLVVIGLSGSGKSTLLRCLNGLLPPTSGEVIYSGHKVTGIEPEIAMIFQNFELIGRHSVLSNVLMGRLRSTPTWKSLMGFFSAEDRARAGRLLELVGLGDKLDVRADELSGGQQQRVAIARALAQQPQVLLADEPVASLDPATSHVVMDYLRKINREMGITVVCNLHFISLVREYAQRVIALKAGEVVYEGLPGDITETWFKKIYGEEARVLRG